MHLLLGRWAEGRVASVGGVARTNSDGAPTLGRRSGIDDERDALIRDLQRTIVGMREALERSELEAQQRFQRAMADAATESDELRATIEGLRTELEAHRVASQEAVQEQRRLAADEARQLQSAVEATRAELERVQASDTAALQEAQRLYGEELRELHSTILRLRALAGETG
jgi:hypothetical protein